MNNLVSADLYTTLSAERYEANDEKGTCSFVPDVRTIIDEDSGAGMTMINSLDSPKTRSDYITRANTEMMSGGGADIYAADILPIHKYADSGQFVNLRELMNNDPSFNFDDYYKNVFDAVMYGGGQYILPLNYTLEVLTYDKNLMDDSSKSQFPAIGRYTYKELIEKYLESFPKHNDSESRTSVKIFNMTSGQFLTDIFSDNYSYFVDLANKKANFIDGMFTGLLNMTKEYEDSGYFDTPFSMNMLTANFSDQESMLNQMASQGYIYKKSFHYLLLMHLISTITNSGNAIQGFGITENDVVIGMPSNEMGGVSSRVSHAFAMNSNSKNQSTAWEFMKYLISEETQASNMFMYAAVNKNAMAVNTRIFVASMTSEPENVPITDSNGSSPEPGTDGYYAMRRQWAEGIELTGEQQRILEEYMAYIETFLSMLDTYVYRDETVDAIFNAEMLNYYNGTKTAQETAEILQYKISMYLQE